MKAIKALQEAMTRIETLETKVKSIRGCIMEINPYTILEWITYSSHSTCIWVFRRYVYGSKRLIYFFNKTREEYAKA